MRHKILAEEEDGCKFVLDMIVFDSLQESKVQSPGKEGGKGDGAMYLLDPMLTMALAGGPIKTMPSLNSCSAKSAFSLRNPYPG